MTMNVRSLYNFFRLRCCNRAQWEIREVAPADAAGMPQSGASPVCQSGPCLPVWPLFRGEDVLRADGRSPPSLPVSAMAGELIVIEGTDGSGKSTQFARLCQRLEQEGVDFRKEVFPRYGQPSAALLEMYLSGQFGSHPQDVNPYAASAFFAVDRYASYKTGWQAYHKEGGLMLCDRYTTSNAVHQASKLPEEQAGPFLDWLFDFEYEKLGLPRPTLVFFLDMPTEELSELLHRRQGDQGDIHEKDPAYLAQCRRRALAVCRRYGWRRVECAPGGRLRDPEQIHQEIWEQIWTKIHKKQ